ncbi:MAG: hypothetical protein HY774_23685 [Acidobacteria bacterium]|nr:hypothetical protein [Acidobacteriota bacterium]
MSVVTIEGSIQDGKIELLEKVDLPDQTRVYVVVPDFSVREVKQRFARIASPRLKDQSFIQDFVIEVIDQEK